MQVRLEKYEYVTALSGQSDNRITSLTFHTNKRKHGPFCKKYKDGYWKREIDVGIRDRSEFGGPCLYMAAILYPLVCMSLTIEAALMRSLEPGSGMSMSISSFHWNHWIIQPRGFITKPRRSLMVFLSSLAVVVRPNSKIVYSPRLLKLFGFLLTFNCIIRLLQCKRFSIS